MAVVLAIGPSPSAAQDAPAAKKPDDAADEKVPEPEVPELTTKDELQLKATYFPGTKGQESIPVIIIHGLGPKSNRKEYDDKDSGLASFLQKSLGCAVIVPDLRGHGESTKWSEALQKNLREQHSARRRR